MGIDNLSPEWPVGSRMRRARSARTAGSHTFDETVKSLERDTGAHVPKRQLEQPSAVRRSRRREVLQPFEGTDSIALNITSCQPAGAALHGSNGLDRDIFFVAGSETGTVSGNTITGTHGESWNVFVHGTTTPVGVPTLGGRLTMSR
jgi:hypothetical protein